MRKALIGALALASAGCSAGSDIATVEREVERFHELAADREIDRLYDQSTDEFKRAATAEQFRALLDVIDERLGDVRRTNRQGWHVNYTNAGTVVTLTYNTQFERGRGTERFVYRVDDGAARLLGFHVNSDALNTRPSGGVEAEETDGDADAEARIVRAPAE